MNGRDRVAQLEIALVMGGEARRMVLTLGDAIAADLDTLEAARGAAGRMRENVRLQNSADGNTRERARFDSLGVMVTLLDALDGGEK
jgi:hypothetical protein